MTIEQIEYHVRRLLCKKDYTIYNPDVDGATGIFYVDESTGNIYIWDGTTYITADNTVQFVDTLPVTGTEGILYVLPDGTIHIWDGAAFITGGVTDHAALTGLTTGDDHTQYLLLAGRTGGQTAIGGTAASNNLTLSSTSNATKGAIIFGDSRYNESTNRLVLGTSTGTGRINLPDAGTTASDGISFGTDISLFRTASQNLRLNSTAFEIFDVVNNRTSHNFTQGGRVRLINNIGGGTQYLEFDSSAGVSQINFNASNNLDFRAGTTTRASILATGGTFSLTPSTLTGSSATSALNITQTWNTTGNPTLLFANVTNTASGASANLMDLQVGGVSQLNINKAGIVTAGSGAGAFSGSFQAKGALIGSSLGLTNGNNYGLMNIINGTSNGIVLITNGSSNDFNRLQLGGTTNAFPSLKRSGTFIECRLADDSGFANLATNGINVTGVIYNNLTGIARIDGAAIITGSALTGSLATSALNITQTWNTTGSPTAINVDITNTASGASANFLDFKLGGVSQIKIDKAGSVTGTASGLNILMNSGGGIIRGGSGGRFTITQTFGMAIYNLSNVANTGVTIGANADANASAVVDMVSTTKGFLPPRMTAVQRDVIASPVSGLTIYCIDATATDGSTGVMQTYNGTAWKNNW